MKAIVLLAKIIAFVLIALFALRFLAHVTIFSNSF